MSKSAAVRSNQVADARKSSNYSRVNVFVRCRPLLSSESPCAAVQVDAENRCVRLIRDNNNPERLLTFDHVFGHDSTQAMVYRVMASSLVDDVLNGVNAAVIAYGQTGSGKTYTTFGPDDVTEAGQFGLIPRALHDLFEKINETDSQDSYTVTLSYLQMYMEKIQDLLGTVNGGQNSQVNLPIREKPDGSVFVSGLSEHTARNVNDVLALLEYGAKSKAVADNRYNRFSSRAHTILTVTVERRLAQSPSANERFDSMHQAPQIFRANFTCVDLAGSERAGKMQLEGQQLEEAKAINKSLSALGNVIAALAGTGSSKPAFVPWRDSKLTRLLQESLKGNSRTCLVVNISPDETWASETVTSLAFGQRAMNVELNPQVNVNTDYRTLCESLQQQIDVLLDKQRQLRIDYELRSEAMEKENSNLQQELESTRIRVQDAEKKIGEANEVLNSVDQLEQLYIQSTEQIETMKKDNNRLRQMLQTTVGKYDNGLLLPYESSGTNRALGDTQDPFVLHEEIRQLNQEVDSLKNERVEWRREKDGLDNRIIELEQALGDVATVERHAQQSDSRLEGMDEQLQMMERAIDWQKKETDDWQKKAESLEAEREKYLMDIAQLQADIQLIRSQLSKRERELVNQGEAELNRYRKQCSSLEEHNANLQQQIAVLEGNIQTLDDTVLLLNGEVDKKDETIRREKEESGILQHNHIVLCRQLERAAHILDLVRSHNIIDLGSAPALSESIKNVIQYEGREKADEIYSVLCESIETATLDLVDQVREREAVIEKLIYEINLLLLDRDITDTIQRVSRNEQPGQSKIESVQVLSAIVNQVDLKAEQQWNYLNNELVLVLRDVASPLQTSQRAVTTSGDVSVIVKSSRNLKSRRSRDVKDVSHHQSTWDTIVHGQEKRIEKLTRGLLTLREHLHEKMETISRLQLESSPASQQEGERIKGFMQDLKHRYDNASTDLINASTEISYLRSAIAKLELELDASRSEVNRLSGLLSEFDNAHRELKKEVEQYKRLSGAVETEGDTHRQRELQLAEQDMEKKIHVWADLIQSYESEKQDMNRQLRQLQSQLGSGTSSNLASLPVTVPAVEVHRPISLQDSSTTGNRYQRANGGMLTDSTRSTATSDSRIHPRNLDNELLNQMSNHQPSTSNTYKRDATSSFRPLLSMSAPRIGRVNPYLDHVRTVSAARSTSRTNQLLQELSDEQKSVNLRDSPVGSADTPLVTYSPMKDFSRLIERETPFLTYTPPITVTPSILASRARINASLIYPHASSNREPVISERKDSQKAQRSEQQTSLDGSVVPATAPVDNMTKPNSATADISSSTAPVGRTPLPSVTGDAQRLGGQSLMGDVKDMLLKIRQEREKIRNYHSMTLGNRSA